MKRLRRIPIKLRLTLGIDASIRVLTTALKIT